MDDDDHAAIGTLPLDLHLFFGAVVGIEPGRGVTRNFVAP